MPVAKLLLYKIPTSTIKR